MDNLFAMDVQRAAIQAMETVYIIATSRNIDTIRGRYDFLLTVVPTLKSAKHHPQYSTLIQKALEQFKAMRPASVPQDYQLAIIQNPDTFDITEFYCGSLINAMKRFCEKQSKEIKGLKKETAKTKRISKVMDTIKVTRSELETKCISTTSYPTALNEIEKLATTFSRNV